MSERDVGFMQQALELAVRADKLNEVPVGAVVVKDGEVIGEGWNNPISGCDPAGHAEIMALRSAAKHLNNYRLPGCELYVTIEPCTMCAGAIVHARIERVVYGALEPKAGAVDSNLEVFKGEQLNHQVDSVGGVLAEQCSQVISDFFARRRREKKAQKKLDREQ